MASENNRSDKVRKALQREIASIINNDIKDPRFEDQVISVTDVEISGDFRHAKVFVSILADDEERNELMTLLLTYSNRIRKLVGERVRLRYTPEIHLKLDESLERGTRVSVLLDQIARGEA